MRTALILFGSLLTLAACSGSKSDTADTADASGTTGADTDTTDSGDSGDSGETDDDPSEPDYPTGDPTGCDLTGQAFLLDFNTARVIKPSALGPILADAIGDALALGVTAQSGSTVDVVLALNEGGSQDLCTPSAHPPQGTWTDPVFAVGPADLAVDLDGDAVTLSSFQFTAAATAECRAIEQGVFQADLDARLLGAVLGDLAGTEDPQGICDALVTFGAACEACDVDGEEFCLKLVVDSMDGDPYGSSLVTVTAEDVAANPDCN